MAELPDQVYTEVCHLANAGDAAAKKSAYPTAISLYRQAWALLPEPQTEWEAATWLLAAIGDAQFLAGDYAGVVNSLALAMHCPNAIDNPFLHLRLGQAQFRLGNLDRAGDELARACMGGGSELFEGEDPSYFLFLKNRLKPPLNGPW